jgi:hypothetical protein
MNIFIKSFQSFEKTKEVIEDIKDICLELKDIGLYRIGFNDHWKNNQFLFIRTSDANKAIYLKDFKVYIIRVIDYLGDMISHIKVRKHPSYIEDVKPEYIDINLEDFLKESFDLDYGLWSISVYYNIKSESHYGLDDEDSLVKEELGGKYKDEVDIIYKSKELICMIPKSQMASYIYSNKTKWCQRFKDGFNNWTDNGNNLLYRFLFNDGRKVRFTYSPQTDEEMYKKGYIGSFYWANENGHHILNGNGDPFLIKVPLNRIRSTEQDVLHLIERIPEECRDLVRKHIENNLGCYDYKYNDKDYISDKYRKLEEEFIEIQNKYLDDIKKLNNQYRSKNINIYYTMNFNKNDGHIYFNEIYSRVRKFSDIDYFEKAIKEVLKNLE